MYIIIAIIVGYILLKLLFTKRYGNIQIGMTKDMVRRQLGSPARSDGKTIRENYEKEVLYYGEYKDARKKVQYKYKVIFENGIAKEIHEP